MSLRLESMRKSVTLRLLLVEDDAVFRRGLREVWADATEICVVAECSTVQEAREALSRGVQFEVGLVDLDLPDGSGLDVLREATLARKDASLLVLTKFAGTDEVGAELQMAQGTVQTHVRQIYRKRRVTSKTEATRTAIRRGWIAP